MAEALATQLPEVDETSNWYEYLCQQCPDVVEQTQIVLADITDMYGGGLDDLAVLETALLDGEECDELHNSLVYTELCEAIRQYSSYGDFHVQSEYADIAEEQTLTPEQTLNFWASHGGVLPFPQLDQAMKQLNPDASTQAIFRVQSEALKCILAGCSGYAERANSAGSQDEAVLEVGRLAIRDYSAENATNAIPSIDEVLGVPNWTPEQYEMEVEQFVAYIFQGDAASTIHPSNLSAAKEALRRASGNVEEDGPLGRFQEISGTVSDWTKSIDKEDQGAKTGSTANFEMSLLRLSKAECLHANPEIFFPDKGGSTQAAKRICSGCKVRQTCLDFALKHDERYGVWGGLSERERRKLKRMGAV